MTKKKTFGDELRIILRRCWNKTKKYLDGDEFIPHLGVDIPVCEMCNIEKEAVDEIIKLVETEYSSNSSISDKSSILNQT